MKIKKHMLLPQNLKPKLTLKLAKQMRDITNQNNIDLPGLKGTSIHIKQDEFKMKIFKHQQLPTKYSQKKISLKNMEDSQDKMHGDSSKQKLSLLQTDVSRPLKTHSIKRRSKTISSVYSKNSFKNISSAQLDQYKQSFYEIEQSLKHDNLLANFNSLFFTIKHEKFYEIVLRIIKALVGSNKRHSKKIDAFNHSIEVIKNHYIKSEGEEKDHRIDFVSQVYTVQHNPQKYKQNMLTKLHKAEDLNQEIKQLQDEIDKKTQFLTHINENHAQKLNETKKYQSKIYQIRRAIEEQQLKLQQTQAKRVKIEQQLTQIQQKYHRTVVFVKNQQKNKILKQISKDYKEIESDIYEYAVYLQSNQLANDIHYQPHPFTEIQKQINLELKMLTADMIHNEQKSNHQKCNQMKDFIVQSMGKFKKKDIEMMKVNEFRTKCIVNFVNKMKKWLSNWELKQQYLVNLKKQFVATTIILKNSINNIISTPIDKIKQEFLMTELATILNLVDQLQMNFNHGNSFY